MIPRAQIFEWRASRAPWQDDGMVEQDLILSRILISIFSDPFLSERLRFRGGTCFQKLFLAHPVRYSEDIDLVQSTAEPVGSTLDALRRALAWLGSPKSETKARSASLVYSFTTEMLPVETRKIKIEINTREHFLVLGAHEIAFSMTSSWFEGAATVHTFRTEELMATKLRALYQRKKGRDLFDLWYVGHHVGLDPDLVVGAFREYASRGGTPITRKEFEQNLRKKLADPRFDEDIHPLLSPGIRFDGAEAGSYVMETYVQRI